MYVVVVKPTPLTRKGEWEENTQVIELQKCHMITQITILHNCAPSQTKVSIGIWSIGYRKANKVYKHCIENSASVWIFGSLLTKFPIEILVWRDA